MASDIQAGEMAPNHTHALTQGALMEIHVWREAVAARRSGNGFQRPSAPAFVPLAQPR
jgi:hypothetical protein